MRGFGLYQWRALCVRNWKKTIKHMKNNTQRGFIPLVAIVILGIVAVAGGTVATISIRNVQNAPIEKEQLTIQEKDTVDAQEPGEAPLGPVSAQEESSERNDKTLAPKSTSANVEANTTGRNIVAISETTRQICNEAENQDEPNTKSLIADIHALCEKLLKGNYAQEDIRSIEQSLAEKWRLWQITESQKRTENFEQERSPGSTLDVSALKTFLSSPTPEGFRTLCAALKKVNIPGEYTEVLSNDRSSITKVPLTLDEAMRCRLLDYANTVTTLKPGSFEWKLQNDDSDEIRLLKIRHNERVTNLTSKYKLTVHKNELTPAIASDGSLRLTYEGPNDSSSFDLYIPEERAQYLIDNPDRAPFVAISTPSRGVGSHHFSVQGTLAK